MLQKVQSILLLVKSLEDYTAVNVRLWFFVHHLLAGLNSWWYWLDTWWYWLTWLGLKKKVRTLSVDTYYRTIQSICGASAMSGRGKGGYVCMLRGDATELAMTSLARAHCGLPQLLRSCCMRKRRDRICRLDLPVMVEGTWGPLPH